MRKALVAIAVLALAGCAGGNKKAAKPVTVSDSDYGRLTPAQTAPVDQARTALGQARDEFARAKLRQTESAQAAALAQADMGVAAAEAQRAEARMKMAQESADPNQLAQARTMSDSARLRQATAQARVDYAQKIQAARAAEVATAEKRVALAEAEVERSKLQALLQAQVPAATKYDPAKLDARVATAQQEYSQASATSQAALNDAINAEAHWRELERQLQARAAPPAPRG
ncbi:MAG TPA: hypothetical protein VFK85_04580 [Anaeromyxobacteraceae bacterium]|nr:hypothetical protein [Anaeromyxobacteraceae bacterium]